jgi:hypothetical protein
MENINLYFDSNERFFPIDMNQKAKGFNTTERCINYYVRKINDNTKWIYYFMYYVQDDGFKRSHIDTHVNDYELVIVEIKGLKINRICFTPHSRKENFWLNEKDTQKIQKNGKLDIYCSRGKHATYPIKGRIFRYFCFANDTNDYKIHCIPKLIELTESTINSKLFAYKKDTLTWDYNVPTISLWYVRFHMLFVLPKIILNKNRF